MKLAKGESSVSNYPALAPRGRGVQAVLTSRRLVWLRDAQEEHYPLDRIAGVQLGFERSGRRIHWALALLASAIALGAALVWAQGFLPTMADTLLQSLADSENPERIAAARRSYQQQADALTLMILPLWGLAGAALAYAGWLLYTGIRGETRVSFSALATTRLLQSRGRDTALLEFGELLAQRAAGLESHAAPLPSESDNLVDWIPTR